MNGGSVDIHKVIGKLPRPKKGFVLPGYNYAGPYNPLEEQLRYDDQGNILEFFQRPSGKTDAIAAQHDVDYTICKDDKKCKLKADRRMVKSLDAVPFNERQWGHIGVRNIINANQKLGLGIFEDAFGKRDKKGDKEIFDSIKGDMKSIFGWGGKSPKKRDDLQERVEQRRKAKI